MFALRLLPVYVLYLLSPILRTDCRMSPSAPCAREISFQHLGESDKPLYALVLSTSTRQQAALEDEEEGTLVQVTDAEMGLVTRVLADFNASHSAQRIGWEYGTFRASRTDSCHRTQYWRYNHTYSRAFFLRLDSLTTQFRPQARYAIHAHVSAWLERL
jgi:hypothetical protein